MKSNRYNVYKAERIKGKYEEKNGVLTESGTLLTEDYVESRMTAFHTSGIYYEIVKKEVKEKKAKAKK